MPQCSIITHPSHLRDTGWQETPEKSAGSGWGRVHVTENIHTFRHTAPIHSPLSNGLSDHLFNTVNKQDKSRGAIKATPFHYWISTWNTHVSYQVYTCSQDHTHKKSFRLQSPKSIWKKTFLSAGFHKSSSEPHLNFFLSSVFNLPIGLQATCLRAEAWKPVFALEPFIVPSSLSISGKTPEGGCNSAHLECCALPNPL